jgi:hypothetical protein
MFEFCQTQFQTDGYVVIENVLSPEEVSTARQNLHTELLNYGIDHDQVMTGMEPPTNDVRKKSCLSNIYYCRWKLKLQLNRKIHDIFVNANNILEETYCPFAKSTGVLPYIDRICYRLPDRIRQEGGLQLHLDRRPHNDEADRSCFVGIKKYRPIQGFIALTDHVGNSSGGLQVVKGLNPVGDGSSSARNGVPLEFHHQFYEYFRQRVEPSTDTGDFYRMHDKSHSKLQSQCQTIQVPAGSLVLWDSRLPHATCERLAGYDSREVVYMSYIPNIDLNVKYWKNQAMHFKKNVAPDGTNVVVDRKYEVDDLSEYERELLGV